MDIPLHPDCHQSQCLAMRVSCLICCQPLPLKSVPNRRSWRTLTCTVPRMCQAQLRQLPCHREGWWARLQAESAVGLRHPPGPGKHVA